MMLLPNNVGSVSSSVRPVLNPRVPTPAVWKSKNDNKKEQKYCIALSLRPKMFAVGSNVNLRQHGLNVLHIFFLFCSFVLKVLKSKHITRCSLDVDDKQNKNNANSSSPIIKGFLCTANVCRISTGHGRLNTLNQSHSKKDQQKVQKMYKIISYHFCILQIPLAQCDPTQVEGRTVAVCLLPVLKCVQAAKSKQQLGSFLLPTTDSERIQHRGKERGEE